MYAVIEAGGTGTRLWPVSRKDLPKQFLPLIGEKSSYQETYECLKEAFGPKNVLTQADKQYYKIAKEQTGIPKELYISEPEMRDNGPAIILAAIKVNQLDSQEVMAIIWADHNISKKEAFLASLKMAEQNVLKHPDYLITIGVKPLSADTGFGYIKTKTPPQKFDGNEISIVEKFVEKPDLETATKYLESGDYLWNTGYKIFSPKWLINKFVELYPEYKETIREISDALLNKDDESLAKAYKNLPKESIESLITEKIDKIMVVPADLGWADIGNWQILHEKLANKDNGCVSRGNHLSFFDEDCLVYGGKKLIATYGLKNIIVVDTPDALLICDKDKAHGVKDIVNKLKETDETKRYL